MISDILVTGSKTELDSNMLDFVSSLTKEELDTHARAMFRWEHWFHSMEVE